jgi:hypothetical protein
MRRWQAAGRWRGELGQAVLLLVGTMAAVLVGGAVLLGGDAQGIGKGREQRAADLGARAMRGAYPRLFEPPSFGGRANPRHLEVGAYKDLGRDAALGVARANGAKNVEVDFPRRGQLRAGADPGQRPRPRHQRRRRPPSRGADQGARRRRAGAADADRCRRPVATASTRARSPTGRASPCAPTWPWRSSAWTPPPSTTGSR